MEEKINFQSEKYLIEGLLCKGNEEKGIVITHPHPLYGGDMHNSVVKTIARAYQKKGYTTLRFNFRGVGSSQGNYENGIGEQKDVEAAVLFLAETGIKTIDLAGYSFGSWVNAHVSIAGIRKMIMVSPPVGFIDFSTISALPCLDLVVTGSRDTEIAPPDIIKKFLPSWNAGARFEVISGADHFYTGYLNELEQILNIEVLNVYMALWCIHCKNTMNFLKENGIAFNAIDIEKQPPDIVKKIIDVNGGKDWVVPTLEYNNRWRPGKIFNAEELKKDLENMGII